MTSGLSANAAQNLIKLVQLTEQTEASEELDGWLYVAIVDDATCSKCLDYEQNVYTTDEAENEFDNLTQTGDTIWEPNIHPNCRCKLFHYNLAKDVPELPQYLSDKEFEDFLSGLLATGVITAAIYDLIMARRKKRKQANK